MAITRPELVHAASMVKAIAAGKWTSDPPEWAERWDYDDGANTVTPIGRAVQTAEAFIIYFIEVDPTFNQTAFLVSCGLLDAPAKLKGRVNATCHGLCATYCPRCNRTGVKA